MIGLAVTGISPQSTVWFTESGDLYGGPYLSSFNPTLVGDGCPGTTSETYSLSTNIERIPWPAHDLPAQDRGRSNVRRSLGDGFLRF